MQYSCGECSVDELWGVEFRAETSLSTGKKRTSLWPQSWSAVHTSECDRIKLYHCYTQVYKYTKNNSYMIWNVKYG